MPRTPSPASFPPCRLLSSTGNTRKISGSVNGKPCPRKIGMRLQSPHTLDSGSVHPPLREFRAGKTARNDPFRSMKGCFPMSFAFIVKHQKLLCPGGDTDVSLLASSF